MAITLGVPIEFGPHATIGLSRRTPGSVIFMTLSLTEIFVLAACGKLGLPTAKSFTKETAMTLSAKSLHRSGAISDKQMAKLQVLRGTRAQKSKMAPFMSKKKDEGDPGKRGIPEVSVGEINNKRVQDEGGSYGISGKREPPSKGGRAGPTGQLHVNEIDRSDKQTPKFPSGGNVKASNPKTGNTRMKAKSKQRSLPMYGKFGGRPA